MHDLSQTNNAITRSTMYSETLIIKDRMTERHRFKLKSLLKIVCLKMLRAIFTGHLIYFIHHS